MQPLGRNTTILNSTVDVFIYQDIITCNNLKLYGH